MTQVKRPNIVYILADDLVLDTLDRLGLAEDTIVCFTSTTAAFPPATATRPPCYETIR
jgi:arylsulfatase A-like enzyme